MQEKWRVWASSLVHREVASISKAAKAPVLECERRLMEALLQVLE